MTASTALVLLIAVVPGALGSYLYDTLNGLDWREKNWGAAIRYVAFSAVGLAFYVLVGSGLRWWPAIHVLPITYTSATFSADLLPRIVVPFLGHLTSSGLVGLAAAWAARSVATITGTTARPGAWDVFVKDSASSRWAVVTLKSSDIYAGYIFVADVGVPSSDRDVMLREPARYDPDKKAYIATPYWDIFLPAGLIHTIAVVRLKEDRPIGPTSGKPLFPREIADEEAKPDAAPTAPTAEESGPRDS